MSRAGGLEEILEAWMARNAPPAPDDVLLRIMGEVDAVPQRAPRLLSWSFGTLAALMATALFAVTAVAVSVTVLSFSVRSLPAAGPVDMVDVRVDSLLDTLHNGTAEEYAALYATGAIIYGNAENAPASPGVGRAAVIASFKNFRDTGTSLQRVGEVSTSGEFVTFHFTWQNGLRMSGTGVTTLFFDAQGLVQYDATFLTVDE